MANIVVNPQKPPETPTSEVVNLQIFLKGEDWESYFSQLQVFRSRTGSSGPYEELTAASMAPAKLPLGSGSEPSTPVTGQEVVLVGTTLELLVNEKEEIVIAFTGSDPLTYADAATQIIAQGRNQLYSYVDDDGLLVVTTTAVGTGAVLEVKGGGAAPQLGLSTTAPSNIDYGEDTRVPLVVGKDEYRFTDIRGSRNYFYKTRYLNPLNGATSDYSRAFSASEYVGISQENLVCGVVRLVTGDGRPICGQRVQLSMEYNGSIVEDAVLAGSDLCKQTDEAGRVEFTLVRGQQFNVSIPGTHLNRTIVSPTDPTVATFNLMSPDVSGDQDAFTVAVPELVTAERRTL